MSKASEIAASMQFINEELHEESQAIEEKIASESIEEKPFKMSDYVKSQVVEDEEGAEKIATEKNKIDADAKMMAGGTIASSGAVLAKHTYDRGNLTGRETLYHNTKSENVESIKKNGLKGQYALDKDKAFTPDLLQDVDSKELDNKVYLSRNKSNAEEVGFKITEEQGAHARETLKAKVPTWKMNEVDNPELRGAKNSKEWTEKLVDLAEKKADKAQKAEIDLMKKNPEAQKELEKHMNKLYRDLSRKGTAVIQGDVSSKYIKGHKGYQKASMKEIGSFIKNNPKRFAKGLGQAGAGVALIGLGGKVVHDGFKQKKSEKVAFAILEEAGLVKTASEKDLAVEKVAYALLEEVGFLK